MRILGLWVYRMRYARRNWVLTVAHRADRGALLSIVRQPRTIRIYTSWLDIAVELPTRGEWMLR